EALRYSLLALGGSLDLTMFGKPVELNKEPYSTRRTIYGYIDRSDVPDELINFDFANPDLPSGRRHETTVPQQALFLMNSPLVIETARKLVGVAEFQACQDDEARIRFLYNRLWQRLPSSEELKLGLDFVSEQKSSDRLASMEASLQPVANESSDPKKLGPRFTGRPFRKPGGPSFHKRAPLKIWEEYAHALLQAN